MTRVNIMLKIVIIILLKLDLENQFKTRSIHKSRWLLIQINIKIKIKIKIFIIIISKTSYIKHDLVIAEREPILSKSKRGNLLTAGMIMMISRQWNSWISLSIMWYRNIYFYHCQSASFVKLWHQLHGSGKSSRIILKLKDAFGQ